MSGGRVIPLVKKIGDPYQKGLCGVKPIVKSSHYTKKVKKEFNSSWEEISLTELLTKNGKGRLYVYLRRGEVPSVDEI